MIWNSFSLIMQQEPDKTIEKEYSDLADWYISLY